MKEFNGSTSTLNFRLQIFGLKKKDTLYEMLYIVSKSGLRRLVFYHLKICTLAFAILEKCLVCSLAFPNLDFQ